MKPLFDRKAFDPVNSSADAATLSQLRSLGRSRVNGLQPSTSLKYGLKETGDTLGVFVDLGCGDSADCLIAEQAGFVAYGIDLFPSETVKRNFIQADVAESITTPDADLMICQAMLDLVEPVARARLFENVREVLAPGGLFVCYIQWLEAGWGFDLKEERERAASVFDSIVNIPSGFAWRKP